jgi:hypothetical protein
MNNSYVSCPAWNRVVWYNSFTDVSEGPTTPMRESLFVLLFFLLMLGLIFNHKNWNNNHRNVDKYGVTHEITPVFNTQFHVSVTPVQEIVILNWSYWVFGFCPSPDILAMTFRKVDLFPSSGERGDALLGPLERANLDIGNLSAPLYVNEWNTCGRYVDPMISGRKFWYWSRAQVRHQPPCSPVIWLPACVPPGPE